MRVQAAVIVLVFSILDRKSLAEVESTFAPLIRQNAPKTAILLVGQDNDARARGTEETSIQDAQDAAGRIGAKCYIECSSATGDWVNTVFLEAVKVVYQSLHPDLDTAPLVSLIPRANIPTEPPRTPARGEQMDVPANTNVTAAGTAAAAPTAYAAAAANAVRDTFDAMDVCPDDEKVLHERWSLEAQREQLQQELARIAFEMETNAKRSRDEVAIAHKDCVLLKERWLGRSVRSGPLPCRKAAVRG
jgi:hypothetical protein